ncbi:hypothetical protein [Burkholderia phage FLC9]|nr:hypothetical protein [Burkholderia phage FLC9]
MPKFERTKPHVNVGTIGHYSPGSGRRSPMRTLMQIAALQAAVAHAGSDTSTVTLYGNIGEDTGTRTYTNMNHGPMIDPRNREERRAKKKKKHGAQTASQYKRRNWWE